jgi:hypothetical protein
MSGKFKFNLYLTRITGTLHEDLRTFVIISRSSPLRMRNVAEKKFVEKNQITHFIFKILFPPKIVPFMRQCEKNIVQPDMS